MPWGSWLLCSSETTTIATLIPFHSASAAARNLGCKLLFPLSPSATIQPRHPPHRGRQNTDLQEPELPLTSNSPTLLQRLRVGSHHNHLTQPPYPILPRSGEMSAGEREVSPPAHGCTAAEHGSSLLVLPWPPQNRCLIKTILSPAHSHALYTQREIEMFQALLVIL